MCNPRRVRVQAKRKIAEAWRAEINQAATAHRDVSSEARLVQSIADLLPDRARKAFEQAMRDSPEWTWNGTEYRRTVPGGTAAYRPDTSELEIVVKLSVAIEAVGTASLVAEGEVVDEIVAEATGNYYDDLPGRTKKDAKKRAKATAESKVEELAEKRTAALKRQAEEKARHELNTRTGEAKEEARRSAEHQLTLQASELQGGLDEQASQQLEAVQTETMTGIYQLVAAGYSAALQAYATEHGENLQVSEDNGVIAIQFELER